MPRKDGTKSRSGPSGPSGKRTPIASPDPVGRPSKLTDDTIRVLEEAFGRGLGRVEACAAAGITTHTLRTWLVRARLGHGGRFAELRRRLHAAEARFRAGLSARVFAAAVDRAATYDAQGRMLLPGRRGDWRAALAALERLDRQGIAAQDDAWAADEEEEGGGPSGGAPIPDVIDAEEAGALAADADDAAVLEARVRSYRRQIARAEADGDHRAVAALARRVERAEDELRAARREAAGPAGAAAGPADPAALDEEAFLDELRIAAEGMPEAHLAAVVGVYLERHRLRLVRDETAANGLLAPKGEA